jgi:hypothetical protein
MAVSFYHLALRNVCEIGCVRHPNHLFKSSFALFHFPLDQCFEVHSCPEPLILLLIPETFQNVWLAEALS